MLSASLLLDGVDASDAGVARLFERVREHRTVHDGVIRAHAALLGIAHRRTFPGSVAQPLDDWLETLRAHRRSSVAGLPR